MAVAVALEVIMVQMEQEVEEMGATDVMDQIFLLLIKAVVAAVKEPQQELLEQLF